MKKSFTIAFLPLITLASAIAQTTGTGPASLVTSANQSAIVQFITMVQDIIVRLVPIAIGLAVLAFFWYLINYIWSGKDGDGDKRKGSLTGMGYSVLAIFVMVSIWGLVQFLGAVLGIGSGGEAPIPGVPTFK